MFKVTPMSFDGFYVTGVDHEALFLNKNTDQLFHMITDKIKNSDISEPLKSYVNNHMNV